MGAEDYCERKWLRPGNEAEKCVALKRFLTNLIQTPITSCCRCSALRFKFSSQRMTCPTPVTIGTPDPFFVCRNVALPNTADTPTSFMG